MKHLNGHIICSHNAKKFNHEENLPSHIHTDLSREQVARKDPDTDQDAAFTSFSCPSRVADDSNCPDLLLHTQTVASKLAEASKFPHGDQPSLRIVRW